MRFKRNGLQNTRMFNKSGVDIPDVLETYKKALRETALETVEEVRWLTPSEVVLANERKGRDADPSTFRMAQVDATVKAFGKFSFNIMLPVVTRDKLIVKSSVAYTTNAIVRNRPVRIEHANVILTFPKEKMSFQKEQLNYLVNGTFTDTTITSLTKSIMGGSVLDKKRFPAIIHVLLKDTTQVALQYIVPNGKVSFISDLTKVTIDENVRVYTLNKAAKIAIVLEGNSIFTEARERFIVGLLQIMTSNLKVGNNGKRDAFALSKDDGYITPTEIDKMFMTLLPKKESKKATLKVRDDRCSQIEDHLGSSAMNDMPPIIAHFKEFSSFWINFEELTKLDYTLMHVFSREYDFLKYALSEHKFAINKVIMASNSTTLSNFYNKIKREVSPRFLTKHITTRQKGMTDTAKIENGNMIADIPVVLEETIVKRSNSGLAARSQEDLDVTQALGPSAMTVGNVLGITKASGFTTPCTHLNPLATFENGLYVDTGALERSKNALTVTIKALEGICLDRDGNQIN